MRLPRSVLIRNILAVASGTAMAQVITFAFSPLITRIYSPEIFGLQGVFLSLISILGPVIALRYPMAIITAETEGEALRLARLSLQVALIMAGLLFLILLADGESVLRLMGAEDLGALVFLLPVALLFVALQDVHDYRAARLGVFRLVGIVEILQAFVTNLVRVLGGLIAPVAAILVSVTTLAPGVKAALLRAGARGMRSPVPDLSRIEAVELLKKHRDFPIYRMPTDVLNAASQAVPVILLAALFSPAAAGLYVLTRSVLNLPTNIVGAAVGNVLYARFAELSREGKPLLPLLLRATGALLTLSPVIIGAAWFAPTVFAFIFGEEWRESGHYARWMALWIGVALANIPAVRLAPVIKAQKILLVANVLILGARVAAIAAVESIDGSAGAAVAVFSVVSLIANFALIVALVQSCNRFERKSLHR